MADQREIKTQAAMQAAADPESTITADDAQKTIVEESKNAGIAAFTFDPDASPEEKRAQAQAVSFPHPTLALPCRPRNCSIQF